MISFREREEAISRISAEEYDVLIVGGGITGAGIAWQSAQMGLKTCLVEMQDFAQGTSSRSTKLIHGGLRYLQNREFSLVRESGLEREKLHERAPHLIKPVEVLLPSYKNRGYSRFMLWLGLSIYDFLARVKGKDRKRMLSASEVRSQEPLLDTEGLKGGGLYREYRTDDARLVVTVLKTAAMHGADCLNYTKVSGILKANEKVSGVRCTDEIGGEEFEVNAKTVINAAGPWVAGVADPVDASLTKRLVYTKGVHLVFDHADLPVNQAIYWQHSDGRMIFAIPRGSVVYVGTTDTSYVDDPKEPPVTREDKDYLLAAINEAFPAVQLSEANIISDWAGVRVLVHQPGKSNSEISRKEEFTTHPSGLISIAGGKLTGFRKMAWRVLTAIGYPTKGKTARALHASDFSAAGGYENFMKRIRAKATNEAARKWFDDWVNRYGTDAEILIQKVNEGSDEMDYVRIELEWCIENESVIKPLDFLSRRTGFMLFERDKVRVYGELVVRELGEALGWDEERKSRELADLWKNM